MTAPWGGTPFEDEYHRLHDEIAALRARVAEVERERDEMRDRCSSEWAVAIERDEARARVASLEAALRAMLTHHAALCGRPSSCVPELEARAALAPRSERATSERSERREGGPAMGEGPCGDCGRPRTSPVHATSMDALIGPTHAFRAWGQAPAAPKEEAP